MASKVVKQLAGDGSGQSLSDMVTAVKHTLAGAQVAKIICKATTEEMMPPKTKHLSTLIGCTFQPQLSIPDFGNAILRRAQHASLVVVFKTFITIHRLMQSGHECFFQYIASNNLRFNLVCLNDRNISQGHGLSVYVRVYASYLEEKARSYCEFGGDLCRLEVGKNGDIRTMALPKVFKMIPIVERLLDAVVAFEANENGLTNPVLSAAYFCLYRDLIHLCAVHNAAMINLLGAYFNMPKRDCQVALSFYKSFVNRSPALNNFIRVAGAINAGLTSSDPEGVLLKPFPPGVLESLEQHLASFKNPPKEPAGGTSALCLPNSIKQSENDLTGKKGSSTALTLSAEQQKQIIEEERARLESFVRTVNHNSTVPGTGSQMHQQFKDPAMDWLNDTIHETTPYNTKPSSHPDFLPLAAATPMTTEPVKPGWLVSSNTSRTSNINPPLSMSSDQFRLTNGSGIPQPAQPLSSDPFSPEPRLTITPSFTFPTADSAPIGSGSNIVTKAPMVTSNPFMPTTSDASVLMAPNLFQGVPDGRSDLFSVDHANAPAASLDDRIAELASNLSLAPAQRRPSEVDWSATSSQQSRIFTSGAGANAPAVGTMRNSSSANQLTGPAVQPASGLTNPWGHYPSPVSEQFAIGLPPGRTLVAPINSWQPAALPNLPVNQQPTAAVARSTNPFV